MRRQRPLVHLHLHLTRSLHHLALDTRTEASSALATSARTGALLLLLLLWANTALARQELGMSEQRLVQRRSASSLLILRARRFSACLTMTAVSYSSRWLVLACRSSRHSWRRCPCERALVERVTIEKRQARNAHAHQIIGRVRL